MEYKIIYSFHGEDIKSFEERVTEHLNVGWCLQGGVGIADTSGITFAQAMVRESLKKN